jgi:sugar phosphate isomerase/epimerase
MTTSISTERKAVYLDELSLDPLAACALAVPFKNVIIRSCWGKNILDMTSSFCKDLRTRVIANGLNAVALSVDIGSKPIDGLFENRGRIHDAVMLASYFGVKYLISTIGIPQDRLDKLEVSDWLPQVQLWLQELRSMLVKHNVVHLIEPRRDSAIYKQGIITHLVQVEPILFLYDPVEIAMASGAAGYQSLLDVMVDNIEAVDVRDCKIGSISKPLGLGQIDWKRIWGRLGEFSGWRFFEPSLGHHHERGISDAELKRGYATH